jgi:hypothetical protein
MKKNKKPTFGSRSGRLNRQFFVVTVHLVSTRLNFVQMNLH